MFIISLYAHALGIEIALFNTFTVPWGVSLLPALESVI